ncbi:MAG: cupin domain-containing protein [Gammaproteobacteria bacterium]|nr:cupin domain-containing protein [Gammaproteobacteria bacterium]
MRVTHIYSDGDGCSCLGHKQIELLPQGQYGHFSELQAGPGIQFREAPADYDSGWHTVPHALYLIILSGRLQIETGDGQTRSLGPGDVILAEDTDGQGHHTVAVGGQPVHSVMVPLQS